MWTCHLVFGSCLPGVNEKTSTTKWHICPRVVFSKAAFYKVKRLNWKIMWKLMWHPGELLVFLQRAQRNTFIWQLCIKQSVGQVHLTNNITPTVQTPSLKRRKERSLPTCLLQTLILIQQCRSSPTPRPAPVTERETPTWSCSSFCSPWPWVLCLLQMDLRSSCSVETVPCSGSWARFNNRCYKYVATHDELGWCRALLFASEGANLVSIHSLDEENFVQTLIENFDLGRGRTWIGLHKEGSWMWSDGCAAKFYLWSTNEPSNSGGNESCVETNLHADKKWNDHQCTDRVPSVCASRIMCPQWLSLI